MMLILGAGGQLGRELQARATAAGLPFRALGHGDLDIADGEAVARVFEASAPSLVVNAAAYTRVDLAEKEIEEARRGNETGPAVVAQACASRGAALIHISTDYVFDGEKKGAYVEADSVRPIGVYGRTKAAGEAAVREYCPRHVILRTSWVYGEFGGNFLRTMLRLAAERDELRVVADQRGCPTATGDIAQAILHVAPMATGREDLFGLYHFAGAGATSWHGFASHIVEAAAPITRRRPKVTAISTADYPTAARRPANSELDSSLFQRTFGFSAAPWQEATDAVVRRLLVANSAG